MILEIYDYSPIGALNEIVIIGKEEFHIYSMLSKVGIVNSEGQLPISPFTKVGEERVCFEFQTEKFNFKKEFLYCQPERTCDVIYSLERKTSGMTATCYIKIFNAFSSTNTKLNFYPKSFNEKYIRGFMETIQVL